MDFVGSSNLACFTASHSCLAPFGLASFEVASSEVASFEVASFEVTSFEVASSEVASSEVASFVAEVAKVVTIHRIPDKCLK